MAKKRVIPIIIVIVLLTACVVFLYILFGGAPLKTDGSGSGLGSLGGSAASSDEAAEKPPSLSEWELPIIVPITGTDSDEGLAAAWGFDYGVKAVNEQGGIRGLPVKIMVLDTASSESEVVYNIGTVAADSLVVMGPPTETLFKAGEQAFYSAGMPTVGAATDVDNREAFRPFAISCVDEPGSAAISAAGTWMRTEWFTDVCIFQSPEAAERTDQVEEALIKGGKKVTEIISLGSDTFDAAGVAEKAFVSGADAFYIDLPVEDTLRVIAQLRFLADEEGGDLQILCGPLAADPSFLDGADGEELFGVYVWSLLDPVKDAEKRKAFDDAFEKNIGDPVYRNIAVDYYQAAIMLKQAIDALGLTGSPDELANERGQLAEYLYHSGLISTDHGDFIIESGGKFMTPKLYKITEDGFQL